MTDRVTEEPFDLHLGGYPPSQKQRFLTSEVVRPQPMEPAVVTALNQLGQEASVGPDHLLLSQLLRAVKPLIVRVIGWSVLHRLTLLSAILISIAVLEFSGGWIQGIGLASLFLLGQLAGASLYYKTSVLAIQLREGASLYLLQILTAKIVALDPENEAEFSIGKLKNVLISEVDAVGSFIYSLAHHLAPALANLIILGPLVFYMAGWAGMLGIIAAFLNIPIALFLSRYVGKFYAASRVQLDDISTILSEWIRNMRLARYLGWQPSFDASIHRSLRLYMKQNLAHHALLCVTFGLGFSWWMFPIVVVILGATFMGQAMNLAGFFTAIWVIKDLCDTLKFLPQAINSWASSAASLKRMEEILGAKEMAESFKEGSYQNPEGRPLKVHFKGVAYGNGRDPILSDLNLTIDLSQKTALVGPVGSGKTTLIRLLSGDLKPRKGEILIEYSCGIVNDLWLEQTHRAFRQEIAMTQQESYITSGTIEGNVDLSVETDESKVLDSLYAAEFKADLAQFEAGTKQWVGEIGVNLSGGQKQRLGLARAFFANRFYPIYDDPLSAVDPKTEALLMQAFQQGPGSGFFLVSHRLSYLHQMDRILYLEGGTVVEDGPPQSLIGNPDSKFLALKEASQSRDQEAGQTGGPRG